MHRHHPKGIKWKMRYRKLNKWRELTRGVKAKWRKTNGRKQGLGISVVSVFGPFINFCFIKHVIDGSVKRRTEVTVRRGRRL